jgi:hypothetical protein
VIDMDNDRDSIKVITENRNNENVIILLNNVLNEELLVVSQCELNSLIKALQNAKREFTEKI